MRSRVLSLLLVVVALLPAARAQRAPAIPDDHTCRIRITDPMRWIDAALDSDALNRLLRHGALGDAISVLGRAPDVDPRTLRRQLGLVRSLVPSEITIAFPPRSSGTIGAFVRAMVDVMLHNCSQIAEQMPEEDLVAARQEIEDDLIETLPQLVDLNLLVNVRCRDARTADDWFDEFAAALEELAGLDDMLRFEHGGDSARLSFVPGAELDRDLVAMVFEEYGIDSETVIDKAHQLLERLSIRLDVRVDDDLLQLRVYPTGIAAVPTDPTAPPEPPTIAGDVVVDYRVDLRELLRHGRRACELHEKFASTEIGTIAAEIDEDDFLADLPWLVSGTEPFAQGSGVLTWSEHGLGFASVGPAIGTLRIEGDPLWQLVPSHTAFASLDGGAAAHELLLDALDNVEGRMELRSIIAEWRENDRAAELREEVLEQFQARVGRLRQSLKQGRATIRPPMLVVAGATPAARRDGEVVPPLPGLAIATRLTAEGTGLAYARELFAALREAFEADFDDEAAGRDLGLGVPTVTLPIDPELQEWLGDCAVHAFEWRGNLVLSTSLELSRTMLEPHTPPRGPAGADTTAMAIGNGVRLATAIDTVLRRVGAGSETFDERTQRDIGRLRLVGAALTESIAAIGQFRMHAEVNGDWLQRRATVQFAGVDEAQRLAAVLDRAREAIGPWPEGAEAMLARGRTKYFGQGTFDFSCHRDGRYHNVIECQFREENTFAGERSWSRNECGASRHNGAAERELVIAWDAIWSGQWTEAPQGMRLSLPPDTLPGDPAAVLLQFPDSDTCFRLTIDEASGLPATYDIDGANHLLVEPYRLSQWRRVDGRMLPHEVQQAANGDLWTIESWTKASFDVAAMGRPAAPTNTTFDGPAEVPLRIRHNHLEVRASTGAVDVWLYFDPAVAQTCICRWVLEEAGIDTGDKQWCVVPELHVGPLRIRDLPVLVVDKPKAEAPDDYTWGQLGYSLLARACVEIDANEQTPGFHLHPPGGVPGRELQWLAVDYDKRAPTLPLRFDDGTVVPCVLGCTGAPTILVEPSMHLDGLRMPRGSDRLLAPWSARMGTLFIETDLSIGGLPLIDAMVQRPMNRSRLFAHDTSRTRTGRPTWTKHFRVVFDLANDRVALLPR